MSTRVKLEAASAASQPRSTAPAQARATDADLLLPSYYAENGYPHEYWASLRRRSPVHRVDDWAGDPYWAVLGHREIRQISKQPERFQNAPRSVLEPRKGIPEAPYRNLLSMDPPEHGLYRAIVSRRFTPRAIRPLQSRIDRICDEVIDAAASSPVDGTVDLVDALSSRVPIWVIAEMMGLPREDWDDLYDWTNASVGAEDPEFQQGRSPDETRLSALTAMASYFAGVVDDRRKQPRDDISSDLANADIDGKPLPDFELLSYFAMLIAAGNETTRNAISGGMRVLLGRQELLEALSANPDGLLDPFVEETLRYVSPVIHMCRTAAGDIEIGEKRVRAGEPVVLFFPAANRDEAVFEAPNEFRIDRRPNPHVAFGIGEHFCLGSHVARMELRAMFRQIARRLDSGEIVGPVEQLASGVVGGIKRMPVRLRWRSDPVA